MSTCMLYLTCTCTSVVRINDERPTCNYMHSRFIRGAAELHQILLQHAPYMYCCTCTVLFIFQKSNLHSTVHSTGRISLSDQQQQHGSRRKQRCSPSFERNKKPHPKMSTFDLSKGKASFAREIGQHMPEVNLLAVQLSEKS